MYCVPNKTVIKYIHRDRSIEACTLNFLAVTLGSYNIELFLDCTLFEVN